MPEEKSRGDLVKQAEEDCRTALNTVPGRKILEYLVMYGGVLVENHETDPVRMAKQEGRRGLALHLITMAGYSPVK